MNKGYKGNNGISKTQVIELIVKEVAKIQTGGLDLSTYAKKSEVSTQISNAIKNFLTEEEIQALLEALDIPTKISELQNDLNLVNKTYVDNAIGAKKHYTEEEIKTIIERVLEEKEVTGTVDEEAVQLIINTSLSQLNIPTKTSQLTNDSNFITGSEVDSKIANASLGGEVDLTSYAKKTELADKVDKVSGKSLVEDTEIERLATLNNYNDTEIKASLNNKVDKVEGKSLVEDSAIEKLTTLNNYDDTEIKTSLNNKVDKEEGKSLISNTEIERLATLNNYDDTEIRTSLSNKVDKVSGKSLVEDSVIEATKVLINEEKYVYNGNLLTNNLKENFDMLILGDSIGAGTASPDNFGFTQMFKATSDNFSGRKKYDFWNYYYSSTNGWTDESSTFSLEMLSSTNSAEDLIWSDKPWIIPRNDYKITIIYGLNTDGGEFDVLDSDDNVLATINCRGDKRTRKFSDEISVTGGRYFKIRAKAGNKAYVNAVVIDYFPDLESNFVFNYSIGGRKLIDWDKDSIKDFLNLKKWDIFYVELFANDSSGARIEDFEDKLRYSITQAQMQGMEVIINITNRNESFDTNDTARASFENWRNLMYTVAKEMNCVLIDFDKMFGGHNKAYSEGLIQDSIHPNYAGHLKMAHVLNNLFFGEYTVKTTMQDDSSWDDYGCPIIQDSFVKNIFTERITQRAYDNNGNYNAYLPFVTSFTFWNERQLPKYAEQGAFAFNTVNNLPYFNLADCQGNKNPSNWKNIKELLGNMTEIVSSLPTNADIKVDTMYVLRTEGAEDKLYLGVVGGNGEKKLIKVGDSQDRKVDKEELVVLSATNGEATMTLGSLQSIVITENTTINLPTVEEEYWEAKLYIKGQEGNVVTLKDGDITNEIELGCDKQHVLKIVRINGEFNAELVDYALDETNEAETETWESKTGMTRYVLNGETVSNWTGGVKIEGTGYVDKFGDISISLTSDLGNVKSYKIKDYLYGYSYNNRTDVDSIDETGKVTRNTKMIELTGKENWLNLATYKIYVLKNDEIKPDNWAPNLYCDTIQPKALGSHASDTLPFIGSYNSYGGVAPYNVNGICVRCPENEDPKTYFAKNPTKVLILLKEPIIEQAIVINLDAQMKEYVDNSVELIENTINNNAKPCEISVVDNNLQLLNHPIQICKNLVDNTTILLPSLTEEYKEVKLIFNNSGNITLNLTSGETSSPMVISQTGVIEITFKKILDGWNISKKAYSAGINIAEE